MNGRVLLLAGFPHMSEGRISWIEDYLRLFRPALEVASDGRVAAIRIDLDRPELDGIMPEDLVIGHELPTTFTTRLSREKIRYVDIRISPARFCAYDNLFAFGTNDPALARALLNFRVPDYDLVVEARSLVLSLRYRDLQQASIGENALVVFTEQQVDRDSIHFYNPVSLLDHRDTLQRMATQYASHYYLHRGDDGEEEPAFLRSLGFSRLDVNMYAVLSSRRCGAIAAIRSGVLEEARYFDVSAIVLGEITTPLVTDAVLDAQGRFINIGPAAALSSEFWCHVLYGEGADRACRAGVQVRSDNLMRRALNNWNSSAIGLDFNTHAWQELVGEPIASAVLQVRDEAEFRQGNMAPPADARIAILQGDWRWFTGEIVRIEASGHVRSQADYGILRQSAGGLAIYWQRRQLIDTLALVSDSRTFETRNQYGDGGSVRRVSDA